MKSAATAVAGAAAAVAVAGSARTRGRRGAQAPHGARSGPTVRCESSMEVPMAILDPKFKRLSAPNVDKAPRKAGVYALYAGSTLVFFG